MLNLFNEDIKEQVPEISIGRKNNEFGEINELLLIEKIDNKKYSDLNLNLKKFMNFLLTLEENNYWFNENTIFLCRKHIYNKITQTGVSKGDIVVSSEIFKTDKLISIKGFSENRKNNSFLHTIHQESLNSLSKFLLTINGITYKHIEGFKFFIYGDGSSNGTGHSIMTSYEAFNLKKELLLEMEEILNRKENIEILIKRFLLVGNKREENNLTLFKNENKNHIDCLYYGNYNNGKWVSYENIIKVHQNLIYNKDQEIKKKKGSIKIGNVNIISYLRKKREKHRNKTIQVIWHKIGEDIEKGGVK